MGNIQQYKECELNDDCPHQYVCCWGNYPSHLDDYILLSHDKPFYSYRYACDLPGGSNCMDYNYFKLN